MLNGTKTHTKDTKRKGFYFTCDCQFYTPILSFLNYVPELSKTKTLMKVVNDVRGDKLHVENKN